MAESFRILRGFLHSDPVSDDCVLFNFKYTDGFGVLQEHDARLALYGVAVVDGDDTRVGRLCLSDLMIAIPLAWCQSDLSFRVLLEMFTTELYFEGKPSRRLSGQLFCSSHSYPCIVSAPVKKQGNSFATQTVECLIRIIMHCFVDLCRRSGCTLAFLPKLRRNLALAPQM